MTTLPVSERIPRVTPLGMRFFDEGAGVPVPDGLVITVTPPTGPAVAAQATPGGTWIAHDIMGLRDVEQGLGTDDWWFAETTVLPCHVAVADALGRFLPITMDLDLPIRDAVVDPCVPALHSSIIGSSLGIPLFSTPMGHPPPHMCRCGAKPPEAVPQPLGIPADMLTGIVETNARLLGADTPAATTGEQP